MAGYTTIKDVIRYLSEQDNLDAPIIYQYYLAEHFEVSEKVFASVAETFESLIPCSESYGAINEEVKNALQTN